MTTELIVLIAILIFGSWFLLDEKRTFGDKLRLVCFFLLLYAFYKLLTGGEVPEIFSPFMELLKGKK